MIWQIITSVKVKWYVQVSFRDDYVMRNVTFDYVTDFCKGLRNNKLSKIFKAKSEPVIHPFQREKLDLCENALQNVIKLQEIIKILASNRHKHSTLTWQFYEGGDEFNNRKCLSLGAQKTHTFEKRSLEPIFISNNEPNPFLFQIRPKPISLKVSMTSSVRGRPDRPSK